MYCSLRFFLLQVATIASNRSACVSVFLAKARLWLARFVVQTKIAVVLARAKTLHCVFQPALYPRDAL